MISKKTVNLLEKLPDLVTATETYVDKAKKNKELVKEYKFRLHRREFKEAADALRALEEHVSLESAQNEFRLLHRFMQDIDFSNKRMSFLEEELERVTALAREKHTLVSELNTLEQDLDMFFTESTKHIHELFLYESKLKITDKTIIGVMSQAVKQLLDDLAREVSMYYSELNMVNKVLPSDSISVTMRKLADLRLQTIKLKKQIG